MNPLLWPLALIFAMTSPQSEQRRIVEHIVSTQKAIQNSAPESNPLFVAFWDFDGTILNGDCSEGFKRDGELIYKGMAQVAIEAGLSELYQADGGFEKFWTDYRYMEHNISEWIAYPFIPQMLRGAKEHEVRALARRQFEEVYQKHYFKESVKMFQALDGAGIHNYIISASADVFVEAAAPTLNLAKDRCHGIKLQSDEGILTERLIYPVTWSHGKTEKLQAIVAELQSRHPKRKVYILAGFGNSYGTDGPFLKYIAEQKLPHGKPLSVMINGGETPSGYANKFKQINL